jgi:hypothetical protein
MRPLELASFPLPLAMSLHLQNSLTLRLEPFVPLDPA